MKFVFVHLFAVLLLASLFFAPTEQLWRSIDTSVFYSLQNWLQGSSLSRFFWSCANHPLADWVEDVCILGFYLAAIFTIPKEERLKRAMQFFLCVCTTAVTIILVNRLLCRDILCLRRASPTLVFSTSLENLPFVVKMETNKSFPADHASTALLFAFSYAYLVRGKLALLALVYGAFLCLPRLMVGAHWLSDIIGGAIPIALISTAWVLLLLKNLNFLGYRYERKNSL